MPSDKMASVVYLHVLNSGHFAFSGVSGFSSRISTYLFLGIVFTPSVCSADLDKFRLIGNLCLYLGVQLGGIAIRVGALCGIWGNSKSFVRLLAAAQSA
jgi:hypothetical protein